jgi:hypothetical protein
MVICSQIHRSTGKTRRRWENNIKMYLRVIGIDEANWIWLAQDRVFCEPSGSIKEAGYCLTSLVIISFSKNILHHGVSE